METAGAEAAEEHHHHHEKSKSSTISSTTTSSHHSSPLLPGMGAGGPDALAAITQHLLQHRLLPRWVARVLSQDPSAFEAALKRQFSKEIKSAAVLDASTHVHAGLSGSQLHHPASAGVGTGGGRSGGPSTPDRTSAEHVRQGHKRTTGLAASSPASVAGGDSQGPGLLQSFWQPRACLLTSRGSWGGARSTSVGPFSPSKAGGSGAGGGGSGPGKGRSSSGGGGGAPGASAGAAGAKPGAGPPGPVSRYRSDFREEQRLGKVRHM